jgi:nucleoside-diphosphate-sugar epimerase
MYDVSSIPHMTEESPMNPPSKKGAVRKRIAQMLLDAIKEGKIMALIARCADFYGPNANKSFVNEVIYKNLKSGKSPNWFVDADKIHSLTYAPDAAKATALLGNTPGVYNQIWHLPTDKNALTGREFIELFSKEMNSSKRIFVLPVWLVKTIGIFIPVMKEMPEMLYQYDRDYFFDSSKFEKNFDFITTTYQEGVKQTVGQTVPAGVLVPQS